MMRTRSPWSSYSKPDWASNAKWGPLRPLATPNLEWWRCLEVALLLWLYPHLKRHLRTAILPRMIGLRKTVAPEGNPLQAHAVRIVVNGQRFFYDSHDAGWNAAQA